MEQEVSLLEQARLAYRPRLPRILSRSVTRLGLSEGEPTSAGEVLARPWFDRLPEMAREAR